MIILLQFLPGSTSLGATVMLYWTKMILEANELENCHCVQWEGKRRGKREKEREREREGVLCVKL